PRLFTAPPPTELYTLSLHDALPICFLRELAGRHGCRRVEGKIAEVETDAGNGCIRALKLENGDVLAGDFFIDCTGFRALLIGQADRKSTRLNSSHVKISYAVFCLKK